MSELSDIQKKILQIKQDLSKISEERWRATLSGNQDEHVKARIKAAEKALENCAWLARYVANFSAPMARQINQREEQARKAFDQVKRMRDPKLLHQWIKEQLIPSTRFAERLGHMAASANKMNRQASAGFHKWSSK